MFIGCKLQNARQGGRRRAATTEKGPNDASGVVWALGEFFFRTFDTN